MYLKHEMSVCLLVSVNSLMTLMVLNHPASE